MKSGIGIITSGLDVKNDAFEDVTFDTWLTLASIGDNSLLTKNIVSAAIRVFAISFVFYALRHSLQFYFLESDKSALIPFFTLGASLAICSFLWFFSYSISSILLPAPSQTEPQTITANDLESIGITLLAMYIILTGIGELFHNLAAYYYLQSFDIKINEYDPSIVASSAYAGFKLIIGVVLLIGLKPLIGLIHNLRTAGLKNYG